MAHLNIKYPIHLENKKELYQHIDKYRDTYILILEEQGFYVEKIKTIFPSVDTRNNDHKNLELLKQLEKQKEEIKGLKKSMSEKDVAIKQRDDRLELQEKNAIAVNNLMQKKRKYDQVESSAKGKTFEEVTKYALKNSKQIASLPCKIAQTGKTKACDIRLEVSGFGVVGIELKDKLRITKEDIDKFDKDRISNNFAASIFWSKKAPITHLSLPKDQNQNGDFVHINDNNKNIMYICSEDIPNSVLIIYVFIFCLKATKMADHDTTENSELNEVITKMFDMIKNHYVAFNKMKNHLRDLDKMMINDIDSIQKLCKRKTNLKLSKVTTKGHLYLMPKTSCINLSSYANNNHTDNKKINQMFHKKNQQQTEQQNVNKPLLFCGRSSSSTKTPLNGSRRNDDDSKSNMDNNDAVTVNNYDVNIDGFFDEESCDSVMSYLSKESKQEYHNVRASKVLDCDVDQIRIQNCDAPWNRFDDNEAIKVLTFPLTNKIVPIIIDDNEEEIKNENYTDDED